MKCVDLFLRFIAIVRTSQSRYKSKCRHWHRYSEIGEHFAVIKKGNRNDSIQQTEYHHQKLSKDIPFCIEYKWCNADQTHRTMPRWESWTNTRSHRNQQRILFVIEFLFGNFLHLADVLHNLAFDFIVDSASIIIILSTGLCHNSIPLRDRQSDIGHFGKVCTFTFQNLPHRGFPLTKQINILFTPFT